MKSPFSNVQMHAINLDTRLETDSTAYQCPETGAVLLDSTAQAAVIGGGLSVKGTPTSPSCPRCSVPFVSMSVGDQAILGCETCNSIWLKAHQVAAVRALVHKLIGKEDSWPGSPMASDFAQAPRFGEATDGSRDVVHHGVSIRIVHGTPLGASAQAQLKFPQPLNINAELKPLSFMGKIGRMFGQKRPPGGLDAHFAGDADGSFVEVVSRGQAMTCIQAIAASGGKLALVAQTDVWQLELHGGTSSSAQTFEDLVATLAQDATTGH